MGGEVATRQGGGGRRAGEDLTALGGGLQPDELRRHRAPDDELAMRASDEEEVVGAAVDTDGHRQPDAGDPLGQLDERPHRPAHLQRRGRGAPLVGRASVEEQYGVATELQQRAAEGLSDLEQLREAGLDNAGDRLGPDLAPPGQAFGHLGEAGHVGEHRRPVEPAVQAVRIRILDNPLTDEPRHVNVEDGRRHFASEAQPTRKASSERRHMPGDSERNGRRRRIRRPTRRQRDPCDYFWSPTSTTPWRNSIGSSLVRPTSTSW